MTSGMAESFEERDRLWSVELAAIRDRFPERGARLDEVVEVGAHGERPRRHERHHVDPEP